MSVFKIIAVFIGAVFLTGNALYAEEKRIFSNQKIYINYLGMKFVKISPGTFIMGSPEHEKGRGKDESQGKVTLTYPFWVTTTEITKLQTKWLAGGDTPTPEEKHKPQVSLNYYQVLRLCEWLTLKERREGNLGQDYYYTLPTEAEWELACRAGSVGPFHCEVKNLSEHAIFNPHIKGTLSPQVSIVASKKPNKFGLYDMHGNVAEWCLDAYKAEYPKGVDPVNLSVTDIRNLKISVRGGSGGADKQACRSASRGGLSPDEQADWIGFRLVIKKRTKQQPESSQIEFVEDQGKGRSGEGSVRD